MRIERFTRAHIEAANDIALQRYAILQRRIPALPVVARWPDLTSLADARMGVAAFEGDRLVGFLCSVAPFENAFRSTDARGAFSPMHGNAAIGEDRAYAYARMVECAADIWADAGATSHAVCLHMTDDEAQRQLFRYGYGMRCVDGIRPLREIDAPAREDIACEEVAPGGHAELLPLMRALDEHMWRSPTFMRRALESDAERMLDIAQSDARYVVARKDGVAIAFCKAESGWAETFVSAMAGTWNLTGAYCLPEHRGSGATVAAINGMIRSLAREGAQRLGVDFESINPPAYRFWTKHFAPYTASVVRRIDERGIGAR